MKGKCLLLLIPLLFSCSNSSSEDDPIIPTHDYNEVSEKFITWENVLSNNKKHYYVYCFSRVCKYCEEMKNEVIDIALNNAPNIYFCNGNDIVIKDIDPIGTIGIRDVNYLFIRGYPSLIEIENNTVNAHYLGRNKVITYLRTLK